MPSRTLLPSPAVPPSPTKVVGPPGSGPVEPEFEITFDTPLAELGPGEYLVLSEPGSAELEGVNEYRYASMDGRSQGRIFHIKHLKPGLRAYVRAVHDGLAWFETERPPGVYSVELASLSGSQFSFGPACKGTFRSKLIGQGQILFSCQDPTSDGDAEFYYAVDWSQGTLIAGWRAERMSTNGWIASNVVEFRSWHLGDESSVERCLVQPPSWTLQCQSMPFAIESINGNASRFLASYPREKAVTLFGEAAVQTFEPIVVGETNCLSAHPLGCSLTPVSPPPEWQGAYSADITETVWAPDNEKIIVLDAECTPGHPSRSWLWYHDLQENRSVAIARLSNCDSFPSDASPSGAIWYDDGQRFVVQDGTSVMLVSLDGNVSRLPVNGYVVGKLTVP